MLKSVSLLVPRAPVSEDPGVRDRGRPGCWCTGAPQCAGGSSRTDSEILGPAVEGPLAGCTTRRSEAPVADQGPARAIPPCHDPCKRLLSAELRAGRNARPGVPTRTVSCGDLPGTSMKEEAAGLVRGRPAAEGRRASSGAWDSEKRGMGAAAAVGGRTALAMALRLRRPESVNRECVFRTSNRHEIMNRWGMLHVE